MTTRRSGASNANRSQPRWLMRLAALMLLISPPPSLACSARSAATYRRTPQPPPSPGNRIAPPAGGQAEVKGGVERLPTPLARSGGVFLIPDDGGQVSTDGVETVAAAFDVSEPASYTGELERQVEASLYPTEDQARRRRLLDIKAAYNNSGPFDPRCAHCLLRPAGVRPLTPAPPIDAHLARQMARRQQQRSQEEPYMFVVELIHNVTEEHVPAAPVVRDDSGNLRRLVKQEDVLRKVDIRIEEAWDKEAFEHRAWHNWDWLAEHYGGERRQTAAGESRLRLGFEPTLGQMVQEMLRTHQTTPAELQTVLETLLKTASPLDGLHDGLASVVEERNGRRRAGDETGGDGGEAPVGNLEEVGRMGPSDDRKHTLPAAGDEKNDEWRRIKWKRGRAPWAREAENSRALGGARASRLENPWARHGQLMSEFENPEDAAPADADTDTDAGAASDVGDEGLGGPGPAAAPDIMGAPAWFTEGRPIDGNEGRLRPFLERLIRRQFRNAGGRDGVRPAARNEGTAASRVGGTTPSGSGRRTSTGEMFPVRSGETATVRTGGRTPPGSGRRTSTGSRAAVSAWAAGNPSSRFDGQTFTDSGGASTHPASAQLGKRRLSTESGSLFSTSRFGIRLQPAAGDQRSRGGQRRPQNGQRDASALETVRGGQRLMGAAAHRRSIGGPDVRRMTGRSWTLESARPRWSLESDRLSRTSKSEWPSLTSESNASSHESARPSRTPVSIRSSWKLDSTQPSRTLKSAQSSRTPNSDRLRLEQTKVAAQKPVWFSKAWDFDPWQK